MNNQNETKSLSRVEKGRINKQNYVDYVAALERDGKRFPLNQFGDINLSAIAEACGFNRQVFATNKGMAEQLKADVKRIGTILVAGESQDSALAKKAKASTLEANKLAKDLGIAEAKIKALEEQVMKLELENKQLKNGKEESDANLEHMLTTGRRFTL
jgi:hypothetical protein